MTLPISYFRFYFPEYVLKTRLPPNCATGFLDSLKPAAFVKTRRACLLPLRDLFSDSQTENGLHVLRLSLAAAHLNEGAHDDAHHVV